MKVLETERLRLRPLSFDDAPFIVELLNEPSFMRYIGDKGVRDRAGACAYLERGPLASYERHGFGLLAVERRDDGEPMGICGLLKREALEDVDLGFAFLPRHWSRGYAGEAARAVLAQARDELGIARVAAITSLDNEASIRLLARLDFRFERVMRLAAEQDDVKLFALELGPAGGDPAPSAA
jgi:ribosomal-protein-alanine N-acetyltransferase